MTTSARVAGLELIAESSGMKGVGVVVSAHDGAALIIEEQQAAGRTVDKMQLQKLLYLVQGAHHRLWGAPAFREPFLAYRRGPVIRPVEQTYRDSAPGVAPIPRPARGVSSRVPEDVAESVSLVLSYFGQWHGPTLERFTKQSGSPWTKARGDLPLSADSSKEIPDDSIRQWFGSHGVNPSPRQITAEREGLFNRAADGDQDAIAALLR